MISLGEIRVKKLLFIIIAVSIVMVGCSSSKYADQIDKAVDKQESYQKQYAKEHQGDVDQSFDKKDANIYVFEEGKYVIIAYKPFKDDEEIHYYTYHFKDDKPEYVKDFNTRGYVQEHEPDYKEENMKDGND